MHANLALPILFATSLSIALHLKWSLRRILQARCSLQPIHATDMLTDQANIEIKRILTNTFHNLRINCGLKMSNVVISLNLSKITGELVFPYRQPYIGK